MLNKVVCPGCGWVGAIEQLTSTVDDFKDCPICQYRNGIKPYRLLTLSEMLSTDTEYEDVSMPLFLKAIGLAELIRVASTARIIYKAAWGNHRGDVCPHGNQANAGWFCDDCFFELGEALEAVGVNLV